MVVDVFLIGAIVLLALVLSKGSFQITVVHKYPLVEKEDQKQVQDFREEMMREVTEKEKEMLDMSDNLISAINEIIYGKDESYDEREKPRELK